MKETFHKTKVTVFFLGLFILGVMILSINEFHTNHEIAVDIFLASLVLFAVSLLWFENHLYKYVRQCGREDFKPNFGPLYVGEVRLTENGKDRNFYIIGNIPFYGLSDFSDILGANTSLKVSWYITIVTTLAFIYRVMT
jgi:predicted permease